MPSYRVAPTPLEMRLWQRYPRPADSGPCPTIQTEMHDAPLPDLYLYGRPGCHLCEEAREMVDALLRQRSAAGKANPNLVERDIETDADWHRAYLTTIPVLELGDQRLELATSMAGIRRFLADRRGRWP
jgi:glutaredoxin